MIFAAGAVMISVTISDIGAIGAGIISGAIITIVILTFGQISGGHVNPALSITAAFLGQLDWKLVPGYIIFQLAGSGFAGLCLLWFIGPYASIGANIPNVDIGVSPFVAFVIEIFLSLFLKWVICATAYHEGGNAK